MSAENLMLEGRRISSSAEGPEAERLEMATMNPFDILGDADNEDPSQLVAAVSIEKSKKAPVPAAAAPTQQGKPAAKLPSKPLPPAQAVREGRSETGRGRGRGGGGRGFGQGRGGGRRYDQDSGTNEGSFGGSDGFSGGYGRPSEEGESGRSFERRGGGGPRGRGGRRGGFSNGEVGEGERPRRVYDRRSGTGRGTELKREGSGRGNWGTPSDEIAPEAEEAAVEVEKTVKQSGEEEGADANKENAVKEAEEPEPEPEEK
ncbi:hypothetical protein CRG98_039792, partial [Punica granatum]